MELKRWNPQIKIMNFLNLGSKKAQAVLELAVFGSILILAIGFLVTYAQQFDFSQRLQMQSYREALHSSYWKGVLGEYTEQQTNLAVIKDKPFAEPSDPFRLLSRQPTGASTSLAWSNNLMLGWGDEDNFENPYFLPKLSLEINNKTYVFTTAGYKYCDIGDKGMRCSCDLVGGGRIRKKVSVPWGKLPTCLEDDIKTLECIKYLITGGTYWTWYNMPRPYVTRPDSKIPKEGDIYKYILENETYDVDRDDKEELVLGLDKIDELGVLPLLEPQVTKLYLVDYQEGEIDTTMGTPERRANIPLGGLQAGYEKNLNLEANLEKQESKDEIINTLSTKTKEGYYRWVRLTNYKQNIQHTFWDFLNSLDIWDIKEIIDNPEEMIDLIKQALFYNLGYLNIDEQVKLNNLIFSKLYPNMPEDVITEFGPDGNYDPDGRWLKIYTGFERERNVKWSTPWKK